MGSRCLEKRVYCIYTWKKKLNHVKSSDIIDKLMSECANHVEMYTAAFQSIIILHSRCVGEQQQKKNRKHNTCCLTSELDSKSDDLNQAEDASVCPSRLRLWIPIVAVTRECGPFPPFFSKPRECHLTTVVNDCICLF